LKLAAPPSLGLRQQEILAADGEVEESPSLIAYRRWTEDRERVSGIGQVKQFDVFTATETSESPVDFQVEVTVESIAKSAGRPAGPRFGTLVHTILRDTPLNADRKALAALAQVHGRLLGATGEEVGAAIDAVAAALVHPLLAQARLAQRLHRELPIILKLDANRVLEGVIDLAFEAEGRWHIVDFKTDADVAANRVHYQRQLHWYSLALTRLNNAPVQAHLLSI
jgi:ATP-dependent exoDNAse (exonuclease V) beta subunit